MAANEAIDAVAGVVGVKLDQPVEMAVAQFVFQDLHFRFGRATPEFAVQILPAPRFPRVVLEPGRVANGICLDVIICGPFRLSRQFQQQFDNRQSAGRFVPMNSGKDAQPSLGPRCLKRKQSIAGANIVLNNAFKRQKVHLDCGLRIPVVPKRGAKSGVHFRRAFVSAAV